MYEEDSFYSPKYNVAFNRFLGIGLDRKTARILASGQNRFDLISSDLNDPLRQKAFKVFDELCEMNYWGDL